VLDAGTPPVGGEVNAEVQSLVSHSTGTQNPFDCKTTRMRKYQASIMTLPRCLPQAREGRRLCLH
jgi:hypothetical protein